jgi:protein-S-isoprenylcysteine O-methyltransferase Ste14
MKIIERIEQDGNFLFRWRSYGPLILVPILLAALLEAASVEARIGESWHDWWGVVCYTISLSGLGIRWLVVGRASPGTSGRNVSEQRADSLNTTGLYSVVRHPLYLGNFLALLGIALAPMVWWFVLAVGLAYWLYIERIMAAEEKFIANKFGAAFEDWAAWAPAFIPKLSLWRPSDRPFSVRTVLKREYNGVLAIAAGFLVLEFALDVLVIGESVQVWAQDDRFWLVIFAVSAIAFVVLRSLKKKTHLLNIR